MTKIFFALVFSFLFQSTVQAEVVYSKGDFSVLRLDEEEHTEFTKMQLPKVTDCRAQISKAVCLVGPAANKDIDLNRKCLPGSSDYIEVFKKIYDHFPATFQKMFCAVQKIYIEKQLTSTAYATVITNSQNKPTGSIMGIRKSVIDQKLDLTTLLSWKEQLSFGGKEDDYVVKAELPVISTKSSPEVNDLLYYIIAHEFGHMFDFANDLNQVAGCADGDWLCAYQCEKVENVANPECRLGNDSWASLSWKNRTQPTLENDFALRTSLCFYWCNGSFINFDQILKVYEGFSHSNFISLYGATNPSDDFADAMAMYLIDEQMKSYFAIDTRQGVIYDMIEKLHSDIFKPKYEYIKNFLAGEITYPHP